jgi:malonate-semialdehyde dehydrogenase (acetylating) / methylmalonate-semialdehyde dehydrogenase
MIGVNVGVPALPPYLSFGGIKQSLVGTDKAQGRGATS